ncbi:MAG: 30S ribosomal protein S6 [Mycoplasmataceae bacterium]|jgi:small subunit ribosomal protein S6|nr:30S ribosomal protein S6 [Mycoplasmataceae bacterium]
MAKYEIDLLVNGSLDEEALKKVVDPLVALIRDQKNFKVDKDLNGLRPLAYKIKGQSNAYYFVYTFECEDRNIINEFTRLCNINSDVLRKLIINIEKTYGYRDSINPKKVKKSFILNKRFQRIQAENREKYANRFTADNSADNLDDMNEIVENVLNNKEEDPENE